MDEFDDEDDEEDPFDDMMEDQSRLHRRPTEVALSSTAMSTHTFCRNTG